MKYEGHIGLRVGITGGIGSGKTTVCRIFESLGVPVYDADYWAKWLLNHDPALVKSVREIFGDGAYDASGAYDRAFVAREAFQNREKLLALNAVAHPAVEQHSRAWHAAQITAGVAYTLKEAALMIESGGQRFMDFLIVVTAPEDIRIQRVMDRDGLTEEQVRARIQHQMPVAEKEALADALILNDGQHSLVQQVWHLHQILLERAKK